MWHEAYKMYKKKNKIYVLFKTHKKLYITMQLDLNKSINAFVLPEGAISTVKKITTFPESQHLIHLTMESSC